jgi:GNAT superfamily N-acetyltransferase
MLIVRRVTPADPLFAATAALFDAYRQHYGANPAPESAPVWLREQCDADRLRVFVAEQDGDARAVGTVAVVPASLTLRTVWLIRDLYVAPDARRGGLARALLAHIADAARAQGAHRLALQSEQDNTAALTLYAEMGFEPVTGLAHLNRLL